MLALSILLSVALTEGGARLYEGRQVPPTGNQYEFYEFDEALGWANKPGATGTFRRQDFSHPVRNNRFGMRFREVAKDKPLGVIRVAVLGDSFTWGLGVSEQERFTELAERSFGGAVEILNFGVSGYAPVQYYLMIDRVLEFRPDVLVVAFCLGNDMIDNVLWRRYGYYKPYAAMEGGRLVIRGYPLPQTGRFEGGGVGPLRMYSAAWRLASAAFLQRNTPPGRPQEGLTALDETGADFYRDSSSLSPASHEAVDAAIRINGALLANIAAKSVAAGAQPVIAIVKTKCDFGLCFQSPGTRLGLMSDRIRTQAAEVGMGLIDVSDRLTVSQFWPHDGHWNPAGHCTMAQGLADDLASRLGLAPPPPVCSGTSRSSNETVSAEPRPP